MSLQFTLIGNTEEGQSLVVFIPGRAPMVADSGNPYFDRLVEGALAGDESVAELFDIAAAAASKFTAVTDRVSVRAGQLYFDGDVVDNALTAQVVRFIEEGYDDWQPLVKFLTNCMDNPNEHSREQMYEWLSRREFAIDQDGLLRAYKGVKQDAKGNWTSISQGKAVVDGTEYTGAIPNYVGAVVTMPRSEVEFDPSVGCHRGLHVGTFDYANGFAQGALLEVKVNPRDIVSVPTDCDAQKVRTCRYEVVGLFAQERAYEQALVYDADEDYGYDESDSGWGDGEYDDFASDADLLY